MNEYSYQHFQYEANERQEKVRRQQQNERKNYRQSNGKRARYQQR